MKEQEKREVREYLSSQGIDEITGDYGELVGELNRRNQWNNPERLMMMKDAMERMSGEARAVLSIVFNAPKELVDFLMQKSRSTKGLMTRHDLRSYLRWYGMKHVAILRAFSEIECLLDGADSEEETADRKEDRKLVDDFFAVRDGKVYVGP